MELSETRRSVYLRRMELVKELRSSALARRRANAYYAERPLEWITDWVDTFDPRLVAEEGKFASIPLILFPRQIELLHCILAAIENRVDLLIEKSRDVGITWLGCAVSTWLWRYRAGSVVGWGSRKQELVDRKGDPKSIFEKMRMILRGLPTELLPEGFGFDEHAKLMLIQNPQNGSVIEGEAGDSIGRGGRALVYFVDEAAHLERAESVEAALSRNTDCQISISSVSGIGSVFHRKRVAGVEIARAEHPDEFLSGDSKQDRGKVLAQIQGKSRILHRTSSNVFTFDWSEYPPKTQEWYREEREKAEREGMLHLFAQEVERNYGASIANQLIKPEWIEAALDLHLLVPALAEGNNTAGLDVADGGRDLNALANRRGMVFNLAKDWAESTTAQTANRALNELAGVEGAVELDYDVIGVGAGVKAELNRLKEEGDSRLERISFAPWNASSSPLEPDRRINPSDSKSPTNKDHYQNLKAQGWWRVRYALEKAFITRVMLEQDANCELPYPVEELIGFDTKSIPPDVMIRLQAELCQARTKIMPSGKQAIEKTPEGMRSPNIADAVIIAYNPTRASAYAKAIMGIKVND